MLTLIPTSDFNIWECRYEDGDTELSVLNSVVLSLYREYSALLRISGYQPFNYSEPLYMVYHQDAGGVPVSVIMHKIGKRIYVSATFDGVVLDFVRPEVGNISSRVFSEYSAQEIKAALSAVASTHLDFGWRLLRVSPEIFCRWLVVSGGKESSDVVYDLLDKLTTGSRSFRERIARVPIGWATGVARRYDLTGSDKPTHDMELSTESTRTPFGASNNARILHEIMYKSWYELVPICTFFEVVSVRATYEFYDEWNVRAIAPGTGEVFNSVVYTPPNRGLSQFNDIPGHAVCWQGDGLRQVSQSDMTIAQLKDNANYAAICDVLREREVNLVLASGESSLYAAALAGGFDAMRLCPGAGHSGQATADCGRDGYKFVADWMTRPACVYPVRIATDVPSLRFAGNVVYFNDFVARR